MKEETAQECEEGQCERGEGDDCGELTDGRGVLEDMEVGGDGGDEEEVGEEERAEGEFLLPGGPLLEKEPREDGDLVVCECGFHGGQDGGLDEGRRGGYKVWLQSGSRRGCKDDCLPALIAGTC